MEIFLLYLVMQLDSIVKTLVFIVTFSIIFTVMAIAYIVLETSNDKERVTPLKFLRGCVIALVPSLTALTLLPSTKSATVLVGAYALKEVSKTESAQRLAGRSVKLIEDWLESLEPAKKEKK